MAVSHGPGRLLVEVAGTATVGPPGSPFRPEAFGGHGVALVQALSLDWGWAPHHDGSRGWALLAVRGASARCLIGRSPRSAAL